MDKIICSISYAIIMLPSLMYIWHKLLSKKINFKDRKLYITLFSITIISTFNYLVVNKFFRVVLLTVIFMIFFRYLFKENIQKTILTPIFYQLIILISEVLSMELFIIIYGSETTEFIQTFFGTFITNILVAIISIIIVNFGFVRNIFNAILKRTDAIKTRQLTIFCLISLSFLNIFIMIAYYKIKFQYLVTINLIVILSFWIIIIYSLKTQNKLNKVSDKYNVVTKTLNDYEDMMTKYRIANHENKNLLKTIRVMILNKEKDIPRYIDTIIEDKYEDDEKLLHKMSVIPSGGLRATIYSEIQKINHKKINYDLIIDRNIKAIDFVELNPNTIVDICKVIGVFIDNAIDEVKKLKEKNIVINLYLDDDRLNIKISNNYKNNIDVEKINNAGYTTKGNGHGYGLALVKQIVESNKLLTHNTEIVNNNFSQIISIKYKKSLL